MEESRTVGIWSWIFSIIVLSIPGLNILYILVLLFGGSKYKSKVNLARAYLLFLILCVIIYLGVFIGIYAYYNNSVDFNQVFENIKDNLQLI